MDRAGLLAKHPLPYQILIELLLRVMLTPGWRNFLNHTGPRFHCFQILDLSRRRIHSSRACRSEGV